MNPIDIALRIAPSAHAGQLDRDGYPVILHPLTVGLMGHTDEEKMAGFLHDVVEDTSYSFEDLLHEGIPTGVVNALISRELIISIMCRALSILKIPLHFK